MFVALLWILIGVVLMGYYNALLLLDNKTATPENLKIKKEWHFVGALIFSYLTLTTSFIWGLKYASFSLSCFWAIFAGIVHIVALKKPFFFVGTTAESDKLIRKYFPKNPELGSAILKCSALLISILLILM